MKTFDLRVLLFLLLCVAICQPQGLDQLGSHESYRLPNWTYPENYATGWTPSDLKPQGYEPALNLIANHSPFNLVEEHMTSVGHEITDPVVHAQVKRAVAYAHKLGLQIFFDLDVRLARNTFLRKHPDQQQWMLRVRPFQLSRRNATRIEIDPALERDHMTPRGSSYEVLAGRLVRVYRAVSGAQQADHDLEDITSSCRVIEQSTKRVVVSIPSDAWRPSAKAIVVVGFEYEYPAIFSPSIIGFQRSILKEYGDTHMDGVDKDEWGYPPVYNEGLKSGDFWYSKWFSAAYTQAGGGEFVHDCVLMALGFGGTYQQRVADVNRYEHLILMGNVKIEQTYYRDVKQIFGPQAWVGIHATWGFMPTGDAFKNGYDWWRAKRSWGGTDEDFPMSLATALAKKMGLPVWYNQFYRGIDDFYMRIWQAARNGGRLSFLGSPRRIFDPKLMRAETRIRLLNFITKAPLNCPVAVVFGHAASLNWVGPDFGDLGWAFAHRLRELGFPADDIPSSEIQDGALRITKDGWVAYGPQRYRALVFLNPDYEPASTFDFLRRATASKTFVFIRGTGTYTFDGARRNRQETLVPGAVMNSTPEQVATFLYGQVYPAGNPHISNPVDLSHLTDGTCILARGGNENPSGREIQGTFYCRNGITGGTSKVTMHATGIFGIRLSNSGRVDALAASDLRFVDVRKALTFRRSTGPEFQLSFDHPIDLAIWRDPDGQWRGVVQNVRVIPASLLHLTKNWIRLALPPPMKGTAKQ
ncbi:MAG TPA: hypothetical protein VFY05_05170 [Candidatus Angelobacter sp.]|nr:hypothetical protein [Candidatus Angelobacter sp.]